MEQWDAMPASMAALPSLSFMPCSHNIPTSSGLPPLLGSNGFKHSLNPPGFQRTPWRHPQLLSEPGQRPSVLLGQHWEKAGLWAEVSGAHARSMWVQQSPEASFRRLSLKLHPGFSLALQ